MSEKTQAAWEITPHMDRQYDSCLILKSADPDGKKAIEYAMSVLAMLWDRGPLDDLDISVTVRATRVHEEDIDDGQ